MNKQARQWLERHFKTHPPARSVSPEDIEVFHFCSTQEEANLCAELVRAGHKTASSSLAWAYSAENEAYPAIGELSLVTDWHGTPQALIETTSVQVLPFNQVDASHAHAEGEGDLSLSWWREIHWRFFSEECEKYGLTPALDMPVVLQLFRVVYMEQGVGDK